MHRAFEEQDKDHRQIGADLEQAPQPAAVLAAELRLGNAGINRRYSTTQRTKSAAPAFSHVQG